MGRSSTTGASANYFQFAPGWSDYEGADNPQDRRNVSGRFWAYARLHAQANALLRRAGYAWMVITANHVISALDAFMAAQRSRVRLRLYGPDPRSSLLWGAQARIRIR